MEVFTCCIGGMICSMKVIGSMYICLSFMSVIHTRSIEGQEEDGGNDKELEMLEKLPYNLNIVSAPPPSNTQR